MRFLRGMAFIIPDMTYLRLYRRSRQWYNRKNMSELPKKDDSIGGSVPGSRDTAVSLLTTMADTTWRMFVPSVGLTLLGVWLDSELDTKPWLMVAGIVLGCSAAFLLVKKQLGALKSRKESR